MTHGLMPTYNFLGFDMKGIRPEGCCPKCNRPFKWNNKKGYICISHLTRPQRFSVIVYCKGERIVRGTDLNGDTLRTFADAHDLRTQAEKEKKAGSFNPAKWKSKKKIEYSFEVLLNKWLTAKEELMDEGKRAPSYVPKLNTYARLYYLPCYGNTDVREIFNLDDFTRFAPKTSLKYQKNVTEALKSFFRWCLKKHYINQLPDFPDTVELPEHMPVTITKEIQLKLLELIPDEHKPIFTWLFCQGCRPSEARALKWDCIDGDVVTYRRGFSASKLLEHTKTKKDRPNLIFAEVLQVLPKKGLPNTFVFQHGVKVKRHYSAAYINKIYRKALADFNEKYETNLHVELYEATKHSFGTQMINENGISLNVLTQWFGHTKEEITKKYAKLDVVDAFRKKQNVIPFRNSEIKGSAGER